MAVEEQPVLVLVPVTVYVTSAAGLAVTEAPVMAERPVAGAHVYVSAPETASPRPLPPEQTVPADGVVVSDGSGFIVRVATDDVSDNPEPVQVVTRR